MRYIVCLMAFFLCQCKTTVSGKIMSPEGEELTFSEGKVNISSLSDKGTSEIIDIKKDGYFETQKDILPGDYLVEPLIPGYQSTSMKVNIKSDKKLIIYARPISLKSHHTIEANNNIKEDYGSGDAVITPPKF